MEKATHGEQAASSPLEIVMGSDGSRVMHVHAHGGVRPKNNTGGIIEATSEPDWLCAMIFTSDKQSNQQRAIFIEPSASEDAYTFSPFFVAGRFRIVTRYNNSKAATQAWKDFRHDIGEHSSAEVFRRK